MLGFFLNPWMLLGLAGVALPVIAHLLSRKTYDLVEWGAMQFLELDPSAKRKVRLEELLLMLVRMGLIAVVAVAMSRPWVGSQWLTGFVSNQPRNVVLVVDGSYSMNWEGKTITPHVQAVQLARQFLSDLRPGDSIQIIDAREEPHLVLPDATRDLYRARQVLNELPIPSGSADLAAAVNRAVQLLSAGTHLHREVVVFTDQQALGWKSDDESLWARFDDVQTQSTISPRIWVVDTAHDELGKAANFMIDRINLSRELAVSGVPVTMTSKVKYSGGDVPISRKVYLEIDGQRLRDQTVQVKLQPQGEATVEFEYRFEIPGSHLISFILDNDALPGDNRADAVVTVAETLPVLLVDGDDQPDPTKCETYFAKAALQSGGTERSWIKTTTIHPEELSAERLKSMSLAILANVATLSESAIEDLRQFVASGHGLLITLGDRVDKAAYHAMQIKGLKDLFPCQLDSLSTEDGQDKRGVRIASNSLDLPWLRPFRADKGGTLSDARWSRWWKVVLPDEVLEHRVPLRTRNVESNDPVISNVPDALPKLGAAVVEIRLTNGDPLIVSRRYDRGVTAILTSSIDADWNTLPAKQDYVPFLHELLFSLASPPASRNTDIGQPLILTISPDVKVDEFEFRDPANKKWPGERMDGEFQPTVRLRTTSLPGVYRFSRIGPRPNEGIQTEYFAVNFDRSESDLTPLTMTQKEQLAGEGRMKFVADLGELRQDMFDETTRAEFWWLLLYAFIGSLVVETWMTRRMVRGGYSEA